MCKTSKAGVWRVIYIHVSFVFLTFWTWLRCWKGAKRETDQIEYNSFLHSQKTCFFRWYMYVACIEILCFYSLIYEYNKCWGCGWQYCMIIIPFTDAVSLLSLLLKIIFKNTIDMHCTYLMCGLLRTHVNTISLFQLLYDCIIRLSSLNHFSR